jgi:hypothetical protein
MYSVFKAIIIYYQILIKSPGRLKTKRKSTSKIVRLDIVVCM